MSTSAPEVSSLLQIFDRHVVEIEPEVPRPEGRVTRTLPGRSKDSRCWGLLLETASRWRVEAIRERGHETQASSATRCAVCSSPMPA